MSSLMKTNLTSDQAIRVLTSAEIGKAATVSGPTDGVFDASDREEGGNAIVWLNDIEKDARYVPIYFVGLHLLKLLHRYARWPTSLTAVHKFFMLTIMINTPPHSSSSAQCTPDSSRLFGEIVLILC